MEVTWCLLRCAIFSCLFTGCTAVSQAHVQHTDTDIKKVHVISMNHLDVGYDGIYPKTGFINNVLNLYFQEYFPRAAWLAEQLQDGGYSESFIYTTHPWLVSLYLDCPPNLVLSGIKLQCPNVTQKAAFVKSVERGDITWHAGPMNMEFEASPEYLIDFGLSLSDELDRRFNISRKYKTLSQRDVPGMTQAVIPSLVRKKIVAVSVGVNDMTAPPAVPNPFIWRFGHDEVIGTWHPGGYPDNPGPNVSHPGGVSRKDCTIMPGFSEALCFAFRTDNSGPPKDVKEIQSYFKILRAEFPGAEISASTFDKYIEALWPFKQQLPVITNEIGDTWIQGMASDPRKMAEFHAVSRVMHECLQSGECSYSDSRVWNASRFLMKQGEHTLGLDSVRDTVNWSNAAFNKAKTGSDFVNHTMGWLEQRAFINLTLEALQGHKVVPRMKEELKKVILRGSKPDLTGFVEVPHSSSVVYDCGRDITIGFSDTGGISHLTVKGHVWAEDKHELGQFTYVTYNETDFKWFGTQYDYNGVSAGYVKVNLTKNAHPSSQVLQPSLKSLYEHKESRCDFWVELVLPETSWKDYGAPQAIWTHYTVPDHGTQGMEVEVQLFAKTSTRLPESLMVSWKPAPQPASATWRLHKVGHMIDPYNVILNGSQYQHAVEGFFYGNPTAPSGLRVMPLDTAIASILTNQKSPPIFPAPLQPIRDEITGVAFNIYNNIWDTNFIFWYPYIEEDLNTRARYLVEFVGL